MPVSWGEPDEPTVYTPITEDLPPCPETDFVQNEEPMGTENQEQDVFIQSMLCCWI